MVVESIFKNPTLIGYLVRRIGAEYPGEQVGKTVLQKMMYLLSRKKIVNFDYSMYHYGPYSSEVSGELNFAENTGIVEVKWIENKGYFIETTPKIEKFEHLLTEKEKQGINEIVKRFGSFNAIELSIIATAFFLKDNFEVQDTKLVSVIQKIKQNHTFEYIESLLQKAEILALNPISINL